MYKLDLEKAEEPKIKLQTFIGLWKKAREFQKNIIWGLVAQTVKCLPTMWENWVRSLGQKDPLEKEMATNSSILVWRIPQMGRLAGYSPCDHKESEMAEQLTQ